MQQAPFSASPAPEHEHVTNETVFAKSLCLRGRERLLLFRFADLQNADTCREVRKGNVDELVQTTGSQQRLIEKLGAVGGSNKEEVLHGPHTVDLREQLVHDAIA